MAYMKDWTTEELLKAFELETESSLKDSIAQNYLDFYYPQEGTCLRKNERYIYSYNFDNFDNFGKTREQIINLSISNQNLQGSLKLEGFDNLKELDCSDNQLTILTLNKLFQLQKINCSNNNLTNLNFGEQITNLDTSNQNLQGSLKLEGFDNLKELDCSSNQLTILTLNKLFQLQKIDCSNNNLTNLNFGGQIINLDTSNQNLQGSLKLEGFDNLKELDCSDNQLTILTLNKLFQLQKIDCSNNNLTNLNFGEQITNLDTSNQNLQGSLKLEGFDNLKELDCSSNQLTILTLNKLFQLQKIDCSNNNLTNLNFGGQIINLDTSNQNLQGSLKLEGFDNLKELDCSDNQLTILTLNKLFQLQKINCSNNNLTNLNFGEQITNLDTSNQNLQGSLKLEGFDNLKELDCFSNQLTILTLNKLFQLDCSNNNLTNLNFGEQITNLDTSNQNLQGSLKLEGFDNLKELDCSSNQLTILTLNKLFQLQKIDCSNNNLTNLNFSGQIINLDISNQNLQGSLKLEGFDNLKELDCSSNQLTILTLNKFFQLQKIDCSNNNLTNLNIDNCFELVHLFCSRNNLNNLNFLNNLNQDKLESLHLENNSLTGDCLPLVNLVNLRYLEINNNSFTGSLRLLRKMNKLGYLNISDTDIDRGLEYLSDNITMLHCSANFRQNARVQVIAGLLASEPKQKDNSGYFADELLYGNKYHDKSVDFPQQLSSIKQRLKNEARSQISLVIIQIEQEFNNSQIDSIDLLQELKTCPETDQTLTDWQNYLEYSLSSDDLNLKNQNVLVAIHTIKSKFQTLELSRRDQQIQHLQKQQSLFAEQEKKINYLELRIWELTNLIKIQKQKIIANFLNVLPEKELIQQLITTYLKFKKAEKQGIDSLDLEDQYIDIKKELRKKLGKEFMEKVQFILSDCENLVILEVELEERLIGKISLIEEQKKLLQIDSNEEKKSLVEKHEKISQEQNEKYQELKLEIAKMKEQIIIIKDRPVQQTINNKIGFGIKGNNNNLGNVSMGRNAITHQEEITRIRTLSFPSQTDDYMSKNKKIKLDQKQKQISENACQTSFCDNTPFSEKNYCFQHICLGEKECNNPRTSKSLLCSVCQEQQK